MKILVISDTHFRTDIAEALIERLNPDVEYMKDLTYRDIPLVVYIRKKINMQIVGQILDCPLPSF